MITSANTCLVSSQPVSPFADFAPVCRLEVAAAEASGRDVLLSFAPSFLAALVGVLVALLTIELNRRHALASDRRRAFAELLASLTTARGALAQTSDAVTAACVDVVARANVWALLVTSRQEKLADAVLVLSRHVTVALARAAQRFPDPDGGAVRHVWSFSSAEQRGVQRQKVFQEDPQGAAVLAVLTESGGTWHRPVGRYARRVAESELVQKARELGLPG